jgi:hypothetical protein
MTRQRILGLIERLTSAIVATFKMSKGPWRKRTKRASYVAEAARRGLSVRTVRRHARLALLRQIAPELWDEYRSGVLAQTQVELLLGVQPADRSDVLSQVRGRSVDRTRWVVASYLHQVGKRLKAPTPRSVVTTRRRKPGSDSYDARPSPALVRRYSRRTSKER